MRKIKILFEGLSSNLGGIETFIHNLYSNIDKNKFEISFLVDKNMKIAYYDEYEKDNIKFYYTENRKKNYLRYLHDLKDIYSNNKFDYIHINVMSYSLFERITYACKYSNAQVIVHSHNGGYTNKLYRTRFLHQIGKFMIRKCKFIKVACGEKAGKFMFGNQKFVIFNNGIDIDKFKYNLSNRKKIRKELNIADDTFVIGLVASFLEVKNHNFIIDVFKEYLQFNKNSLLLLVGEGPLKDLIKNKVKYYDIEDKVLFLGKRYDTDKLYSAMDCYVMPSFSEGLSISLCEAQVNGLKCYTTDGVDKDSNITGNVEFLSLNKPPKEWAEYIYKSNNKRDKDVLNKIPDEFNSKKSYQKVFEFYQNNLK